MPVADSQVYERTIEVFFNVFMQIQNELMLIACGIIQVLRMQRTIEPQVMTRSGPFPLVTQGTSTATTKEMILLML